MTDKNFIWNVGDTIVCINMVSSFKLGNKYKIIDIIEDYVSNDNVVHKVFKCEDFNGLITFCNTNIFNREFWRLDEEIILDMKLREL